MMEDLHWIETGSLHSSLVQKAAGCMQELLEVEQEEMAGSLGQMGVDEIVEVGGIVGAEVGVVGAAQKKMMMMKMEYHMEKVPAALGYCSPQTCVLAEKRTHPVDHHIQQGYLGTQAGVLNNFGLLDIRNFLNVEGEDPWALQGEGSHCCLEPQ